MANKKAVIIGGGFGGLAAAKVLANTKIDVTLIDRANHHLFQPLLYQVATAGLSPANVAQPLRYLLRDDKNITVIWTSVTDIQTENKKVVTPDGDFEYDYLIVAAGARHSYFGKPEWEQFAPGLKTLEDAVELRRRILTSFELAEKAHSDEERKQALTFVVIGGGPTGVEMAGAIAELAHQAMARDFRRMDPKETKVILLDAAPRVLPMFAEELSEVAKNSLADIGVDVRTGVMVKNVDATGVEIPDGHISARTVVWAAGNAASPLGKMLGAETDRAGRTVVEQDLSVKGHPEIFAVGDMAAFTPAGQERSLPGVSPVAMQMGKQAAKNVRLLAEGQATETFRYHDKGSMATIGRNHAVADLKFIKLTGFMAWAAWLVIHLAFIVSLRNQFLVFAQWIYSYLTFGKSARLITGKFTPGQK